MIHYKSDRWSLNIVCILRGSVFPRAMLFACPCAMAAAALHYLLHTQSGLLKLFAIDNSATTVYSGFNMVLGFLVVFRAQLAYNRWWEGGTLLCQVRGEWFDSFSALIAFCNADPTKAKEVEHFQKQIVRLYSLLYCCALAEVSPNTDDPAGGIALNTFELMNLDGFDSESLKFLNTVPDMCELTMQWIQRSIVEANDKGIIKIAPPILSRVFNELGNGIVYLNNARKIKEFPFPFPMAQLTIVMMICQSVVMPFVAASTVKSGSWCTMVTFVVNFCFWGIVLIALELEMPYGDDNNDLPLCHMAMEMNKSLRVIIEAPLARKVPGFKLSATSGLDCWDVDLDTDLSLSARSAKYCEEDEELEEACLSLRAHEVSPKKLASSTEATYFTNSAQRHDQDAANGISPGGSTKVDATQLSNSTPTTTSNESVGDSGARVLMRSTTGPSATEHPIPQAPAAPLVVAENGARARLMGAIDRYERSPAPPDVSERSPKQRATWERERADLAIHDLPGSHNLVSNGLNGLDHKPPDITCPEKPTTAPPAMPGMMTAPH